MLCPSQQAYSQHDAQHHAQHRVCTEGLCIVAVDKYILAKRVLCFVRNAPQLNLLYHVQRSGQLFVVSVHLTRIMTIQVLTTACSKS